MIPDLLDWLRDLWPTILAALGLFTSVLASAHVVLNKRDVRAAAGWVGVIWLAPLLGALLYVMLGVNRIRRQALALQRRLAAGARGPGLPAPELRAALGERGGHLVTLAGLVDRLVRRPLVPGNRLTPLPGGDTAYPAMLDAIESAERSVTFCSYIFDRDRAGLRFVDALAAAHERGVEVRVLVDAAGIQYSWPRPVDRLLRRRDVRTARFLPLRVPWRMRFFNLRNHRKTLVVDGRVGFTGGMNIRAGHVLGESPRYPVDDVHFRAEGPVVAHLQDSFVEDWQFTTGERLTGQSYYPELGAAGPAIARGISDGPDEDFEKLRWTLHGALAAARRSVRIVTPYFLPDAALITALCGAALRGVEVDIVLPAVGNLRIVQWAATAQLWQVLEHGCRVHLTPPPFDHSKLMVVDESWVLLGSSNWDPRSYRLNFEFNVECYDSTLAAEVLVLVDARLARAHLLTLAEVDARSLPVRLRDGTARVFAPYL